MSCMCSQCNKGLNCCWNKHVLLLFSFGDFREFSSKRAVAVFRSLVYTQLQHVYWDPAAGRAGLMAAAGPAVAADGLPAAALLLSSPPLSLGDYWF